MCERGSEDFGGAFRRGEGTPVPKEDDRRSSAYSPPEVRRCRAAEDRWVADPRDVVLELPEALGGLAARRRPRMTPRLRLQRSSIVESPARFVTVLPKRHPGPAGRLHGHDAGNHPRRDRPPALPRSATSSGRRHAGGPEELPTVEEELGAQLVTLAEVAKANEAYTSLVSTPPKEQPLPGEAVLDHLPAVAVVLSWRNSSKGPTSSSVRSREERRRDAGSTTSRYTFCCSWPRTGYIRTHIDAARRSPPVVHEGGRHEERRHPLGSR